MRKKRLRYPILLAIILFISIGFAVLSTNLSINGIFNFTENTWNIYLDNVIVDEDGTTTNTPTINNNKDTLTFSSALNKPGDYYSFKVDVVNNSTIDAMLGSIVTTGINPTYSDYLDCNITYSNGVTPNTNDILYKNARVTLKVTLTYKDITTSQIPENTLSPTVSITINCRQANNNAVLVTDTNHWDFSYTGAEQTFTPQANAIYKLETWGGKGGDDRSFGTDFIPGGYGGYSVGTITTTSSIQTLYISVGGGSQKGTISIKTNYEYNGAGLHRLSAAMGGGATHIATVTGELKNLESQKGTLTNNSYYISDKIIIVSGGGGGASDNARGGHAGGYIGHKGYGTTQYQGEAGTQIDGYAFGKGEDAGYNVLETAQTNYQNPAGGAGFFGGYAGGLHIYGGGGGGSSYIASSLLKSNETYSITKHMTCYDCTTSNDAEIKTQTTTCAKEIPTADCTKIGNGYARITILGLN